jgi:circadian clock protein KaiB
MTADRGRKAARGLKVRLYVAGRAPNSVRAEENLRLIADKYDEIAWEVEVVDVLVEPLRALADGVLVTPTLIRLAPPPEVWIVGDLSREAEALAALGLHAIRQEAKQPESGG